MRWALARTSLASASIAAFHLAAAPCPRWRSRPLQAPLRSRSGSASLRPFRPLLRPLSGRGVLLGLLAFLHLLPQAPATKAKPFADACGCLLEPGLRPVRQRPAVVDPVPKRVDAAPLRESERRLVGPVARQAPGHFLVVLEIVAARIECCLLAVARHGDIGQMPVHAAARQHESPVHRGALRFVDGDGIAVIDGGIGVRLDRDPFPAGLVTVQDHG